MADKVKHTGTYIGHDENDLEYIIYEYTRWRAIGEGDDDIDYMPGLKELATDDGRPVLPRRNGYVVAGSSGDIPITIDGIEESGANK